MHSTYPNQPDFDASSYWEQRKRRRQQQQQPPPSFFSSFSSSSFNPRPSFPSSFNPRPSSSSFNPNPSSSSSSVPQSTPSVDLSEVRQHVSNQAVQADTYFTEQLGNHREEFAALTTLLQQNPLNGNAFASRAAVFAACFDFNSALNDCNRAIQLTDVTQSFQVNPFREKARALLCLELFDAAHEFILENSRKGFLSPDDARTLTTQATHMQQAKQRALDAPPFQFQPTLTLIVQAMQSGFGNQHKDLNLKETQVLVLLKLFDLARTVLLTTRSSIFDIDVLYWKALCQIATPPPLRSLQFLDELLQLVACSNDLRPSQNIAELKELVQLLGNFSNATIDADLLSLQQVRTSTPYVQAVVDFHVALLYAQRIELLRQTLASTQESNVMPHIKALQNDTRALIALDTPKDSILRLKTHLDTATPHILHWLNNKQGRRLVNPLPPKELQSLRLLFHPDKSQRAAHQEWVKSMLEYYAS